MLSSSKGLFFAENLNNFFRGYVVEFVWLNVRLVLATREKHNRTGQHFAVVVHSCMSRGPVVNPEHDGEGGGGEHLLLVVVEQTVGRRQRKSVANL